MALSVKTGTFDLNTSAGNQAVTGVGFQPSVVIFLGSLVTTSGFANDCHLSIGAATSSTDRWAFGIFAQDNIGTSSTRRHSRNNRCFITGNGATTLVEFDLVSLDSDGFTINITDADPTAFTVAYIALAGSDISNVKVGTGSFATSGATQSITGFGFQPDFLLVATADNTPINSTNANHAILGIGVATSGSAEAAAAFSSAHNVGNAVTNVQQVTTATVSTTFNNAQQMIADVASFDSDGVTFNVTDLPTATTPFGYIAIKGCQHKIGVETQKTSTGTQAKTGVGFTPKGLMMFGAMRASSASIQQDGHMTIGYADGTNNRAVAVQDVDGANTMNNCRHLSVTTCVGRRDAAATTTSEAALSSFDSDGYTLNWTTADATAREFVYWAIGENPAAAFVPKVLVF